MDEISSPNKLPEKEMDVVNISKYEEQEFLYSKPGLNNSNNTSASLTET